jgi:excisionase family DNA binding protein
MPESDRPTAVTALPVKQRKYSKNGRPLGRPPGARNRPKPADVPPALKPRALQINRAAAYGDVSETTVRRWIKAGLLTPTRIGTVVLIPLIQLDALLDGRATT